MSEVKMKGLKNFIGEIRKAKTREDEQGRVEKELANVRSNFTKKLDIYNKKKYLWKLIYIHLLGYEVDIGHMEALQMITSQTYTEKNVGYIAASVLLNENSDLLRLIIQSVKNDLTSKNEAFQCLALNTIANVGGQEFAESLTADVQTLLLDSASGPFVKKKAALALLRLFRKFPESIPAEKDFPPKVLGLMDDTNLGVLISVSNLLLGVVAHDTKGYGEIVTKVARILTMLVITYYWNPKETKHRPTIEQRHAPYSYWHTMCPWLQIRLFKLLQFFPPPEDPSVYKRINDVLSHVLTHIEVSRTNVSKNNADHAILFECLNTVIHYCVHGKTELQKPAVEIIAKFITVKEPNIRYLGLDTMARLGRLPGTLAIEGFNDKKRFEEVKKSLTDQDISIRKRALDLMYVMCDRNSAGEIVGEMLDYLKHADYEIKDELVLKIAIVAEKFAQDLRWYIDTILQLITIAGDFVSEDIWFRVVQMVTNHEEVQEYAATTMFKALQSPTIHESGVKVGGYLLGEFGHTITDESVTGSAMFKVLFQRFPTASLPTKAILLSSFVKMANAYPELKEKVNEIFGQYKDFVDQEIQQRAVEYSSLFNVGNDELLNTVFEIMPNFPERESALIRRINKMKRGDSDGEKKQKQDDEEDEDEENESAEEEEEASGQEESEHDDEPTTKPDDGGLSDEDTVPERKEAKRELDLFGFDAPSPSTSSFPSQKEGMVSALFGQSKGVLYESDLLQIGVQVKNEGSQSKMALYYGNKSESPMSGVTLSVPNMSQLQAQVRPPEPIEVAEKKQTPHYLLWQCVEPFTEPPTVSIAFSFQGSSHTLKVKLPVFCSQFINGINLDANEFIAQWKKLEDNVVKVYKAADVIEKEQLKRDISDRLRLTVLDGLEKDDNNFAAAGNLSTAGGSQTVLLRLETKPGKPHVRISAHASSQALAEAAVFSVGVMLSAETF